jgi:hypothetical protein
VRQAAALRELGASRSAELDASPRASPRDPQRLRARVRSRPSSRVSRSWSSAAPVDADAHRLVVPARRPRSSRANCRSRLLAVADVAGVDAVLGERRGAGRIVGAAACGRCSGSRRPAARRRPRSRRRSRICGTAARGLGVLTVTRTSSEPARAQLVDLARGARSTSAVSVLVMDWTTTGCAPPTGTRPTWQTTLFRRSPRRVSSIWIRGMGARLGAVPDRVNRGREGFRLPCGGPAGGVQRVVPPLQSAFGTA